MSKDKTITIPGPLLDELNKFYTKSIFPSLDDLIIYILQEYLDKQNASPQNDKNGDDEIVRERLKNLGYL